MTFLLYLYEGLMAILDHSQSKEVILLLFAFTESGDCLFGTVGYIEYRGRDFPGGKCRFMRQERMCGIYCEALPMENEKGQRRVQL